MGPLGRKDGRPQMRRRARQREYGHAADMLPTCRNPFCIPPSAAEWQQTQGHALPTRFPACRRGAGSRRSRRTERRARAAKLSAPQAPMRAMRGMSSPKCPRLDCRGCGAAFRTTPSAAAYHEAKGEQLPAHCLPCRVRRKAGDEAGGPGGGEAAVGQLPREEQQPRPGGGPASSSDGASAARQLSGEEQPQPDGRSPVA